MSWFRGLFSGMRSIQGDIRQESPAGEKNPPEKDASNKKMIELFKEITGLQSSFSEKNADSVSEVADKVSDLGDRISVAYDRKELTESDHDKLMEAYDPLIAQVADWVESKQKGGSSKQKEEVKVASGGSSEAQVESKQKGGSSKQKEEAKVASGGSSEAQVDKVLVQRLAELPAMKALVELDQAHLNKEVSKDELATFRAILEAAEKEVHEFKWGKQVTGYGLQFMQDWIEGIQEAWQEKAKTASPGRSEARGSSSQDSRRVDSSVRPWGQLVSQPKEGHAEQIFAEIWDSIGVTINREGAQDGFKELMTQRENLPGLVSFVRNTKSEDSQVLAAAVVEKVEFLADAAEQLDYTDFTSWVDVALQEATNAARAKILSIRKAGGLTEKEMEALMDRVEECDSRVRDIDIDPDDLEAYSSLGDAE